jgi:hypothetical protein
VAGKRPVLFVRDELGRVSRCRAVSLLPDVSRFVEPLIYVYARSPEPLEIRLSSEVRIFDAAPPAVENGWTVTADTEGRLLLGDGSRVPWIFWEGRGARFPRPPEAGTVVLSRELSSHLAWQLPRLGLRGREVTDFLRFWVPVLAQHPAVLIDFMVNEEVDAFARLQLSRALDQTIRVYLNYRPWIPGEAAPPASRTHPVISRNNGDVLVEWGGVHWAASTFR